MTEEPKNMFVSTNEALFLKLIFHGNGGVHIGYIAAKLGISINQTAKIFIRMHELGYLDKDENVIYITHEGRKWVINNQFIFAHSGTKPWRLVPERFRGNRVEAFQPYTPKKPQLNKKAFGVD